MSGIVGIVNLHDAPVDAGLLARMTQFLAPRGPDAQSTWIKDNVGFGHALLVTDPRLAHCPQPCTLDGRTWITADVRLDARDELLDKLCKHTFVDIAASDPELLLEAYKAWGKSCLEHLFGEFVFAIWDSERRRLFCAHDQLGIRPLYFAHIRGQVIFSNTLDCVRQHPNVSVKINDAAIGDFLLFGLNYDPSTTSFADIQRLPPGNFATWNSNGHVQRRYWQLPIDEPVFYRRQTDYIDQFQSLLRTSVRERLPAGKIGVSMSGGLDSSLLAAVAHNLKAESGSAAEIYAVTYVYDRLFPDQERYYSSLVAHHLRIPQHFFVMDEPSEDELWSRIPEPRAEPSSAPWATNRNRRDNAGLASLGRVYFYGQGPDNALRYEWRPYLEYLARQRQWGRLLKDVVLHMWLHRRIPLLATWLSAAHIKDPPGPNLPEWLNPKFCAQVHLEGRWREIWADPLSEHPLRPSGYASFQNVLWQYLFETRDSNEGQFALEYRHPYLNVPLLRFMLALPALPWCRVKYIQRAAAQSLLPIEILTRPKEPLSGSPQLEMAKRMGLPPIFRSALLQHYILPDKVRYDINSLDVLDALRAVGLSYWLHDLAPHSKCELENAHGASEKSGP